MEYKGLKKDLFNQIFYTNLENAIIHYKENKGIKYSERELKGYINKLIDVFSTVEKKEGKYYIYASQLTNLKRNPLDKIFNVFVKNENSTYHRNSSTLGNNGYTHWYDIKEWFIKLYEYSLEETYNYIKFNKKYENTLKECKTTIKRIKQNNLTKKNKEIFKNIDEYLEIDKNKFLELFNLFQERGFDFFSKYLENMFYYNKDFVYINNNLNNGKIDKFDGLGRKYTVLTSTKKNIRKFIFKGFTEIDINSCSASILCNLWLNDILNKDSKNDLSELKGLYDNLFELITDKKSFRKKYQRILNTNEDRVKKIITHLLFEPNTVRIYENFSKEENEEFENNLLTIFEVTNPKKGILFNHLVRELLMIRRDVIDTYYEDSLQSNKIKKYYINNLDIRKIKSIVDEWFVLNKSNENKSPSKIIHKIIELVENQIRELVFEFLLNKGINNVYQIHDAFIFNDRINMKDLEEFIYEKIGFIFKFSEEKY